METITLTSQMIPSGWLSAWVVAADSVDEAKKKISRPYTEIAVYDRGEKHTPRLLVMFRLDSA